MFLAEPSFEALTKADAGVRMTTPRGTDPASSMYSPPQPMPCLLHAFTIATLCVRSRNSFTGVEFCDYSSPFRETGSSGSWEWESCASVNSALNPTPRTRPAGGSHFYHPQILDHTGETRGSPPRNNLHFD